jgi:subfamily B ATP-binding cassette protein MsbA
VRVVKAFAMERFENTRFLAESKRLFRDMFKIARMQALSSPLTEQLSTLVGLFVLWYGGRQVLTAGDQLPPDLFILFLVCIFSLVHPVKELSGVNNGIQEGMAAAERIFAVLDAPDESAADVGAEELGPIRGQVAFDHVSFGYGDGAPVLRDVTLTVEPGEVVALVGASGAGKSTLVDLIPRFYEPREGRVLIDGRDIRRFTLGSLRRAMGIVTQDVILFNDTVRANIAYGLSDVSDEQIEAAARAANAHEFIAQMPKGYLTPIGDRGVLLSGGQRQRISIARAILKNPPILIFDEATSSLDTESELLVQEAIDRLVRNRTTFVIAHRLSTIQNVDRIHVLRNGQIVQTGTHAELLAEGGPYRVLHDLQFRA